MTNEKDDRIIVNDLRPMSDLMKIGDYATMVLGYTSSSKDPQIIRQASDIDVFNPDTGKFSHISVYIGWIPMPIYKPKKVNGD
ncbi:MAG: hypothetical protein OEY89_12525 [Gammaproteobacteria bacterium]|nr:hypothetical protein [Gammaproteobacteria bacterium]